MLYHVSSISGIKILHPRVSSHGKAYVYAIEDIVTGLLFGAKHDDFDFYISNDENNKPIVYECYPNAFEIIYKNKSCYVYEIDEKGFQRGVTGWSPEFVCENEVEVKREFLVSDIYSRLLSEQLLGNIIIHKYRNNLEYKKIISEHIVDRLIRFDALDWVETDRRFQKYYKNMIEALRSIMDGHLL